MKLFEKLLKRFFWVPLILGVIGYYVEGEMDIWHCIYASMALYFVNPINDMDNVAILIAEILAVLVTTSVVLSILGSVVKYLGRFFIRLSDDATVVYGDSIYAESLSDRLHRGYHVQSPKAPEKVRDHILMYEKDTDALRFLEQYRDRLKDDRVYLILNTADTYLLADTKGTGIHYQSLSELCARRFWRQYDLYDRVVNEKKSVRIAIIGTGSVGMSIFRYGYLNNVYTTTQHIEYHIFGANAAQKCELKKLVMVNDDAIFCHDEEYFEYDGLSEMDMCIVSSSDSGVKGAVGEDDEDIAIILARLLHYPSRSIIYVYEEGNLKYEDIYASDRIVTFGAIDDLLTEDGIKNEPLDLAAKLFNYDYELRAAGEQSKDNYVEEAEKYWQGLNGFFRGSNVARADHHYIEMKREAEGAEDEEIWDVEHTRWCRYYYINGWEYNEKRDNSMKKHHLLIPYDELELSEKKKDGIYDERLKKEIERICK